MKGNILSIFLFLVACVPHKKVETPPQTLRICDDTGCTDRPKGYASFDPDAGSYDEEKENIALLEKMAAQDPRAAYDLALRFFRGEGVRQDSYRSIQWMRDAAERGEFNAQKALGRLYLTGLGEMGSDPGEAEKWLSITASRGDKEARTLLKEATQARQSEQDEYAWRRKWHPVVYRYWYSGYSYYWYWEPTGWRLQSPTIGTGYSSFAPSLETRNKSKKTSLAKSTIKENEKIETASYTERSEYTASHPYSNYTAESDSHRDGENTIDRRESELNTLHAHPPQLEHTIPQDRTERRNNQDEKEAEKIDTVVRELEVEKKKRAALEQEVNAFKEKNESHQSEHQPHRSPVKVAKIDDVAPPHTTRRENTTVPPPHEKSGLKDISIQLIDPPLATASVRGIPAIPTIELKNPVSSRSITGNVYAPSGVSSFVINDHSEAVTETGMFTSTIPITGERTQVNITLVDKSSKKANLDFVILSPKVVPPSQKEVQEQQQQNTTEIQFGNYYALLIGNNSYKNANIPSLETPINDITEISKVLASQYGFKVKHLENATRYDVLTSINEFRTLLTEQDNLLIYYAGHGELDRINQRGQGYR